MKKALITGYTGQDGTFLTRLLLNKGYTVIGLVRRISTEPPRRIRGKFDFSKYIEAGTLILEEGDLLSPSSLTRIIETHLPDEIYNLAAQSHVGVSFNQPEFTIEANLMGTINLLEALESCSRSDWKMYQASTSEMFGNNNIGVLLDEMSRFEPRSPYAIAKTAAHFYCRMKRDQGRFVAAGILFNHESEIRGGDFVTQKIARAAAGLARGSIAPLFLGNLDSRRDWGYAGDYVEAMWLMLQQETPGEFVIGTGEAHSVREFVEAALDTLNMGIRWEGKDQDEVGYLICPLSSLHNYAFIRVSKEFYRPNEVGYLNCIPERAREKLGWDPKHSFKKLVQIMVYAQLNLQEKK